MLLIEKCELMVAIAAAENAGYPHRPRWSLLDRVLPGETVSALIIDQRLDGAGDGAGTTYRLQLYIQDGTVEELDVDQRTFDVFDR